MTKRKVKTSFVDGNHLLYHYLEKDLREADIWLFQMLAARLFTSLGVWFPPALYSQLPILIPYAIRDPTCRPAKTGDADQWGCPNKHGYFRDDNSLVKGLPRSLQIHAPTNPLFHRRILGPGFVAAHVWRILGSSTGQPTLASRDAHTNTFVPNLVWLPSQVAKLTDREGSFAQAYLQALAIKIYRNVEVAKQLQGLVNQVWDKLPTPQGIPPRGLPNPETLAYFAATDKFVSGRLQLISTVKLALECVAAGDVIRTKIVSSRYTLGLPALKPQDIVELRGFLSTLLVDPAPLVQDLE